MMELTRHPLFSDHFKLIFFELLKIPKTLDSNDLLGWWLELFRAEKLVDLKRIYASGVPIMPDAVTAFF